MSAAIPALSRLVLVPQIAAAFIFDQYGVILSREVPKQYDDQGLQQIAKQMLHFAAQDQLFKSSFVEFRLHFENFTVWFRSFSKNRNYFLVVFLQKGADVSLLRQPINLAILNLEKVVQSIDLEREKQAAESDIARAAQEAERDLLIASGDDSNHLYAKLSTVAKYFIGPVGSDILLQGCRELTLRLPITDLEQMRALVQFCAEYLQQAERKRAFIDQCEDVIQRTVLAKQSKK